ncbi:hypothetical protein PLICRDRAFT_37608 [Plicaturopsis crispa FD-325 SS-3]|nr:hypothetical protein PLICRDRAFT_37608 [Plicaturopsis crispa FD-325 SS-3]
MLIHPAGWDWYGRMVHSRKIADPSAARPRKSLDRSQGFPGTACTPFTQQSKDSRRSSVLNLGHSPLFTTDCTASWVLAHIPAYFWLTRGLCVIVLQVILYTCSTRDRSGVSSLAESKCLSRSVLESQRCKCLALAGDKIIPDPVLGTLPGHHIVSVSAAVAVTGIFTRPGPIVSRQVQKELQSNCCRTLICEERFILWTGHSCEGIGPLSLIPTLLLCT